MKPIGDITVVTCIFYLKFISIDICKNLLRVFLVVEQLKKNVFLKSTEIISSFQVFYSLFRLT